MFTLNFMRGKAKVLGVSVDRCSQKTMSTSAKWVMRTLFGESPKARHGPIVSEGCKNQNCSADPPPTPPPSPATVATGKKQLHHRSGCPFQKLRPGGCQRNPSALYPRFPTSTRFCPFFETQKIPRNGFPGAFPISECLAVPFKGASGWCRDKSRQTTEAPGPFGTRTSACDRFGPRSGELRVVAVEVPKAIFWLKIDGSGWLNHQGNQERSLDLSTKSTRKDSDASFHSLPGRVSHSCSGQKWGWIQEGKPSGKTVGLHAHHFVVWPVAWRVLKGAPFFAVGFSENQ